MSVATIAPSSPVDPSRYDIVFLRDGTLRRGKVLGADPHRVRIAVDLAPGQPPATLSLPLEALHHIDFAPARDPAPGGITPNPEQLEGAWRAQIGLLAVPSSDAGQAGLAAAEALLARRADGDAARALEIASAVAAADWDGSRRARARAIRLRALSTLGRETEAAAEADQIARNERDQALLAEAHAVLGELALGRLESLVREHPRWRQDPEVLPGCEKLFHETLDLLLYPHLFLPSDRAAAARGLARCAAAYRLVGAEESAGRARADLAALYPESAEARALLEPTPETDHTPPPP